VRATHSRSSGGFWGRWSGKASSARSAPLVEDIDYIVFAQKGENPQGGRPSNEYFPLRGSHLEENKDFRVYYQQGKNPQGGQPSQEYRFGFDAAPRSATVTKVSGAVPSRSPRSAPGTTPHPPPECHHSGWRGAGVGMGLSPLRLVPSGGWLAPWCAAPLVAWSVVDRQPASAYTRAWPWVL
jgi:hypothetical protein